MEVSCSCENVTWRTGGSTHKSFLPSGPMSLPKFLYFLNRYPNLCCVGYAFLPSPLDRLGPAPEHSAVPFPAASTSLYSHNGYPIDLYVPLPSSAFSWNDGKETDLFHGNRSEKFGFLLPYRKEGVLTSFETFFFSQLRVVVYFPGMVR